MKILCDVSGRIVKPTRILSVDEQDVYFQGRHPYKRKMGKFKPGGDGFCVITINLRDGYLDGFTHGFLFDFDGMNNPLLRIPGGSPMNLLFQLVSTLQAKGHVIYCDNLFLNVPLAEELWKKGQMIVGTARRNSAGFPRICKVKKETSSVNILEAKKKIWIASRGEVTAVG